MLRIIFRSLPKANPSSKISVCPVCVVMGKCICKSRELVPKLYICEPAYLGPPINKDPYEEPIPDYFRPTPQYFPPAEKPKPLYL